MTFSIYSTLVSIATQEGVDLDQLGKYVQKHVNKGQEAKLKRIAQRYWGQFGLSKKCEKAHRGEAKKSQRMKKRALEREIRASSSDLTTSEDTSDLE